jgi:hypothetical protein
VRPAPHFQFAYYVGCIKIYAKHALTRLMEGEDSTFK